MLYKNLFSPIKIGNVEIKNRTAMMPMGVFSARMMNPDGSYTKDGADYYIERAKGGTGLIITGLVPIENHGLPYINKDPESYIKNQKYLVDGIHKYGAKVFIQMTALSGRSTDGEAGADGPSEMPYVWNPLYKTRQMTKEDIKRYIENFANGAYTAMRAGIDGVEIHAVHEGYLLDQFTIACMNDRDDEYGGSLENRLRFPVEIVKAIKAKCGSDYPVSIRYSVKSYIKGFNRGALPGEEFTEFGRDYEESKLVAKMLEEAGYDMLNCDNGTYDSWYWPHPPVYMPKACNLEDVSIIKKVVNIPVICAGKFDDPKLADEAIKSGKIDMMGMGRPLLADPDLVNKFANNDLADVRPCIGCHMACLARIFQFDYKKMALKDISCALNPRCGREESYALTKAAVVKNVCVVGGGIAGMEAARVLAIRGHKVTLFEKSDKLGGVFIAASAFDFKDDDKRLLKWYKKQMADLHIDVRFNTEFTKENAKSYDEVFVATGAIERKLSTPGFDDERVSYAVDYLLNKDIHNQNVVVIGGGLTGCEIAYDLGKKGNKVTLVEMENSILNVEGLAGANYNMLVELLEYYKVNVLKGAVVNKYENGVVSITQKTTNMPNVAGRALHISAQGIHYTPIDLPADNVIVSVGYIANQNLYESIKGDNVHLIGDANHPGNLMSAIWDAYEIAMKI